MPAGYGERRSERESSIAIRLSTAAASDTDRQAAIEDVRAEVREQLDERQFWQIHRNMIVAAKLVEATHTDFRGRLMVKLKGRAEQLVVSRNYVDQFKQM